MQALAELFCHVAAQRATAQHQVLVAQQDLGALVAGALGALKLQVLACALLRSNYALLLQTLLRHASVVSKSRVCQHLEVLLKTGVTHSARSASTARMGQYCHSLHVEHLPTMPQ